MGGDHKCPVCQATFTRPQHVARHMRSHTGDRPYKCQYCGDQFARSDLLSRHVNKCHANEKPPPGAANARRKGSASACRATTSKQACDQCVQSSLPCDGCNPCAKCVQRKSRCTFVKFHRQTAPAGPGHNPRPSGAPSSRLPGFGQADEFLLGPAPSSMAAISDNPYASQFSFPYPPPTDPLASSLAMPPSDADYAKLRAHADYLRRQQPNTMPTAGPGVPPVSTSLPASMFDPRNPNTSWLGWSGDNQMNGRYLPPLDDSKQQQADSDLHAALARSYGGNPGGSTYTYPPVAPDPYGSSYLGQRRTGHDRHPSADFASDGSSASVPSSATSSNVHLPLDLPQQQQLAYHVSLERLREQIDTNLTGSDPQDAQVQAHANFLAVHPQQPDGGAATRASATQQNGAHNEGGFSSAFGLMSLEDPNVMAGLSADGAPFFSSTGMDMYPGDPDATPMPAKSGSSATSSRTLPTPSAVTPSREAETKELRDFWKQYLRTPLTGPNGLATPSASLLSGNPISPNSGYRRPRVASLPSVKTPTTELYNTLHNHANAASTNNAGAGPTSSMRTTLHGNPDDLRSYEAAVLARPAPLQLNLVPKRARGHSTATSPMMGLPTTSEGATRGGSGPSSIAGSTYELHAGLSRPASSSSTSSLAHAFGKAPPPSNNQHVTFAYQVQSAPSQNSPDSASPPSRASTASLEDSDRDNFRPSFKRLPSQTLGPANAKRAMLDHDEDSDDERHVVTDIDRHMSIPQQHLAGDRQMMPPPPPSERPIVGISHRQRRMSAPSTSPTAPTFMAAGQL
ncbi:hypothetical protein HGRIS_000752 [Hohenbuehelia grisea]|uniref:Uncharacterized protein n=1 Tax=Hohenbuehelia grisea TaxID=104357 RepID=A0ABR3IPR9_9AGAR